MTPPLYRTLAWRPPALVSRMGSGVFFNLVAAVFNQGSTLLVSLVVANLLGREVFGRYTMVLTTVTTVAAMGQLSMGYTATKYLAEFRTVARERAGRILGLCLMTAAASAFVAAGVLALGAPWIAGTVLGDSGLRGEFRLAALPVLFLILNGCLSGALAGLEAYRLLARAGIVCGTAYLVICTVLTWSYGLPGAIAGLGISALLQTAVLALLLGREATHQGIPMTVRGVWTERAIVRNFALPASLAGAITLPAAWLASAMLARQPGGFHQLALFGAASTFRAMVLFVPQAVNNVGMSLLNNQRRSDEAGYRQVFWVNALLTAASGAAIAATLFVAARPLLELFGPSFADGTLALGILLTAALVEALSVAAYQVLVAHGRIWASFIAASLPRDIVLVASAAILVPSLGVNGLALAHVIGWLCALTGILLMVRRVGLATPSPHPTSAS